MDRHPVEATGLVSPEAFEQVMQQATRQMLHDVIHAVNQAPDGQWINGSEMQVRDLLGEYRRRVFEAALQIKTEAAEGAFPPTDPSTGQRLKKKGTGDRSTLTANGRVSLRRRRWQHRGGGAVVPVDPLLDRAEATVSRGTRQLCCRLNGTK